jgi:putative nucleotidyltransferase with HDIG domain
MVLTVNGNKVDNKNIVSLNPYTEIQLYILNGIEDKYIYNFEIEKSKKIAVVKGTIIEKYLEYKGLEKQLVFYENIEAAVNSVSEGETDLFLGSIQQINHILKREKIKNLKIAGITMDKVGISFGVNKNDESLFFLLSNFGDKFFLSIDNEIERYMTENIAVAKDYKLSITILILSIIGFIIGYINFKKLKILHKKLKDVTLKLVETLESANTYNDEDTGAHIKRVSEYSRILAKELKLKKEFIDEVELYASLHDVGKIGIRDSILKKPGKLTDAEFEIMKTHVDIGADLVKNLDAKPIIINIIKYHHEKWNGHGYKGLKKEDIPLEARILAVADVYDALRQERVYKKGFTHERAVEIIVSESGEHFDPEIVEVFKRINDSLDEIFEKYKKIKKKE